MEKYSNRVMLEHCLKAMAILDIIVQPKEDAWLRLVNGYRFPGGSRYVIDNGSGDNLIVIFTENETLLKGFDHENELNQFAADEWNVSFFTHMFANIPDGLMNLLEDEEKEETTFCMWCSKDSGQWLQNETEGNDGGAAYLLKYICQNAKEWCDWAEEYYEISPDPDLVAEIYKGGAVTEELIGKLNPKGNMTEILEEIAETIPG